MSSAYLRLLIFLLAILIPACASSSPVFLKMYSTYKLNNQGDNIQPWHTPFPIWNQCVVPCPALIVASWPACKFLKRQVRCQFIVIHTVKGLGNQNLSVQLEDGEVTHERLYFFQKFSRVITGDATLWLPKFYTKYLVIWPLCLKRGA